MLESPRIMIASAFGRGNWLSVRLTRLGFNVQLIDVTENLGLSSKEDQEGPFGYFDLRQWGYGEREALSSFGPTTEGEGGLTLWLKNGPWELRGPSSIYRSQMLKQYEQGWPLVHQFGDVYGNNKLWYEKLQNLKFEERWIACLASDYMSNRSQKPNEAFLSSVPVSLFEKYFTRIPEKRNHQSSLKWCSEQGVVVVEGAGISDLAIENKKILGLEIKTDKSQFVRCHHLIWMMTSLETEFLSSRAYLKLYKGQFMEPEWCWLRYKINFEPTRDLFSLPNDFLFIEDLQLPWAHDNYAIFRKSFHENSFHVWLRLPYSQRFHRDYLLDRIEPLIENLKTRNSRLKTLKVSLPSEATSHFKELGAPLYPIYRSLDLDNPPGIHLKNLKFSHPEQWQSYSWGSIFSSQNQIASELKMWWGEMSDEQKHKELAL